MHAAVVHSFHSAPKYETFAAPQPSGQHEALVEVLAAGLHLRVRAQADGSHYTSTDELPLIPGIDGVGRLPDGRRVYFVATDTALGSFADQTVIDLRRSVPIPAHADPVLIAAAMNPAMSSWVTLRRRIQVQPGFKVLVLGATGSSGQMAVQIAKLLGGSQVIAAGRDPERLEALRRLGADATVSLAGDPEEAARRLGEAAAEVDIVLDYLWGQPAELGMLPLLTRRPDRSRLLTWIQIGSVAGANASIPSAALRSANFQLIGSGQGSITPAGYLAEFPALIDLIASGKLILQPAVHPLSSIEEVWNTPEDNRQRIVFVPSL
ncbi:zinc-binding alcohol dehydrogenase family protein [Paenibacillus sp. MMS20-IR301]|uniref:quinone oxidoreductase family protein n=1 Tax=Paenibacillus sp. MMS20-IR301 TaxID=2895946 RepID=UPI0028EDEF20|nr:zinc-binding alcohol dehydrogenase family protein [Paenibacillus sp. MMS20-IR301]WNS45987.1 zinc-binding alcohol dehydrogenase family protein [Paenibacillus sp. MMS20-IR301]